MLSERSPSAPGSMRSTTCSAGSTGATTSSGSSTGRPSSRSTARSRARAPCSRRRPSSRSAAPSTRTASRASRSSTPARAAQPGDLLREIHRLCHPRGHRLVLFDSLDSMVRVLGPDGDARVLRPLLPDAARVRGDRLLVDERARDAGVVAEHGPRGHAVRAARRRAQRARGSRPRAATTASAASVLHWHDEGGRPVLAPPEIVARVAASLRAVRRARELSQHDLGDLAGVTASAISQVERAERGLSLATLVRLSAALGRDDRRPAARRGARRVPDRPPHRRSRSAGSSTRSRCSTTASLHIDLVHLGAREAGEPPAPAGRARRSSPSPPASSRSRSRARRRRSATARSWSPTASRSTAGATSARRRRCCSGSCSRASRTTGLRRSARRTPAGRSEPAGPPLGLWWHDRNRHIPSLAPEPRGPAEARAWRDARLRGRDHHRPRPRRSTTRSSTASPACPSIVMRSPSDSR